MRKGDLPMANHTNSERDGRMAGESSLGRLDTLLVVDNPMLI